VRVHCFEGASPEDVIEFTRSLDSVEAVFDRKQAAEKLELPFDVEADVVVISEENYCLGAASKDHDIAGLNGARLRTHGGFSEQNVPFVISQPLNADYAQRANAEQLRNYHIFDFAINGTA